MINDHGATGSDDPDESPGAAADDDRGERLLVRDHRDHATAFRQNHQSRKAARGVHGSDPGAKMLPRAATIDVQVRQHSFVTRLVERKNFAIDF